MMLEDLESNRPSDSELPREAEVSDKTAKGSGEKRGDLKALHTKKLDELVASNKVGRKVSEEEYTAEWMALADLEGGYTEDVESFLYEGYNIAGAKPFVQWVVRSGLRVDFFRSFFRGNLFKEDSQKNNRKKFILLTSILANLLVSNCSVRVFFRDVIRFLPDYSKAQTNKLFKVAPIVWKEYMISVLDDSVKFPQLSDLMLPSVKKQEFISLIDELYRSLFPYKLPSEQQKVMDRIIHWVHPEMANDSEAPQQISNDVVVTTDVSKNSGDAAGKSVNEKEGNLPAEIPAEDSVEEASETTSSEPDGANTEEAAPAVEKDAPDSEPTAEESIREQDVPEHASVTESVGDEPDGSVSDVTSTLSKPASEACKTQSAATPAASDASASKAKTTKAKKLGTEPAPARNVASGESVPTPDAVPVETEEAASSKERNEMSARQIGRLRSHSDTVSTTPETTKPACVGVETVPENAEEKPAESAEYPKKRFVPLKRDWDDKKQFCDELQKQNDELQKQNDELQNKNDKLQKQNDKLWDQIGSMKTQIGELERTREILSMKTARLTADKTLLEQRNSELEQTNTSLQEEIDAVKADSSQTMEAIRGDSARKTDETISRLTSKLRGEYRDFKDSEGMEMTTDLGENLRDQLSEVFSILKKGGFDLK